MNTTKRRKVGIMGGTFDPIHIGHLILGENAYRQFELDTVLFMPSGNPPHKRDRRGRATTEQRTSMVQMAIENNAHFELSLAEAHDEGYTYTKETLTRLTAEHPNTDYYFIIGADSLFSFETWKEPEEICQLCTLVAALRNHIGHDIMDRQIAYLEKKFQGRIQKLDTPNIDISSGTIRDWVKAGKSLRYYVPDPVIDYMKQLDLYKESDNDV